MSQAKFDPVEAAKVEAPASKKTIRKMMDSVEVAPAQEPSKPIAQAPMASKPAVEPPKPSPEMMSGKMTKFRVKTSKMISWYGSMTTLSAGSIVDWSGYGGPAGIARLVEQGVELEPIE